MNGDVLLPAQENLFLTRWLATALFRLTYALETAKDMSWHYRLLSDREWSGRYAVALNAGVNGIYLSRTNLDAAFDDDGRQINPLLTRLTGNFFSFFLNCSRIVFSSLFHSLNALSSNSTLKVINVNPDPSCRIFQSFPNHCQNISVFIIFAHHH